MNTHEEYEKISVMNDSGASETVVSVEKFEPYPIEKRTASDTTYSSAAGKQAEDVVNVGQRHIPVVGDHDTESWAKFQMSRGPGHDKVLGSVSRWDGSGLSVVFRHPEQERYILNNSIGYRTYFAAPKRVSLP